MNWLKLFKKRVRLQTDTKGNSVVWVFKCVKYKIAQTTTNAEGKSCPYWEEVRERIWGIFSDEKKCLSWCAINISDYEDGYYNIGILEPVKIDTTPYCFNLNTHFFLLFS